MIIREAIICTIIILTIANAHASLIPLATTSSNQKITATIKGSSLLYGEAIVKTNSYALALSLNPGTLTYPAIHSALASAEVQIPNDGATIATFNSAFNTTAKTFSSEPLFSRSAATGQSSVYAVATASSPAIINLDWTFNELSLRAEPTSTFAYISDTVHVVQATTTGIQETVTGFFSFLENGKQTTGFLGNTDVTQVLKNWFDSNTTQAGNQVTLNANPDKLNIDIALAPQQELFLLRIDDVHTEISYEAPAVATKQTDEKIGHLASHGDHNRLHWDKNTGLLSFDRLPINLLTNDLNQQYADDQLSDGYLEIDPLQLAINLDGRKYFVGNEFRLVDNNGDVLYRASLPGIVFDDTLFANQGFNLFAPILNILEAKPDESNWLQDYLTKVNIASLLLPELFIGFNPANSNDDMWQQSFDAPTTTFLSFSGVPSRIQSNDVSEPGVFMLFSLGLLNLLVLRQYRNRTVKML